MAATMVAAASSMAAARPVGRFGGANALRAAPLRASRASRQNIRVQSAADVKFNYDTKVFKKELVK